MSFKVQVGPPQIAIHHASTVLVTESNGEMVPPSDMGLYLQDTRVISAWAVEANGMGWVLLNDKDLYANFEAIKQDIALVPQKDVLHDSLAVGQALWYTAKLRLPPDTTPKEIDASLGDVIRNFGKDASRISRHDLGVGSPLRVSLEMCQSALTLFREIENVQVQADPFSTRFQLARRES